MGDILHKMSKITKFQPGLNIKKIFFPTLLRGPKSKVQHQVLGEDMEQ